MYIYICVYTDIHTHMCVYVKLICEINYISMEGSSDFSLLNKGKSFMSLPSFLKIYLPIINKPL